MAGVELEISELNSDTLVATSILHSKDGDGGDIIGTVQNILDLVPGTDVETYQPPVGLTLSSVSDYVIFSDASDSGIMKRVDIPTFISSLGLLSVSGSITSGYYNLGDLQFRWGTETSAIDDAEEFTFAVPFTTEAFGVFVNSTLQDATNPLLAREKTASGFTVDRNSNNDGSILFYYLAVGR